MKTRLYFLDNLRTFLILLVVLLHSGIVYESILQDTWIVSDPAKNSSIGLIRMYLDLFVMFIIFFISGYFIPRSIKNKNNWEFFKSKFNRIMLPWIMAVFTLIPAYKVIFLYSRGLPQEEWYTYFHIFQRVGGNPYLFSDNPVQNWLWFLPVLFLFQVVYLALSKTNALSMKLSLRTGVLLTLVLGLVYSLVISFSDLSGWFNSSILHFQRERLLVYFMVFLLGSLCYELNIFESNTKNKKNYIWANVALTLAVSVFTVVALNLFFNMITPDRNYFFISEVVDRTVYYATLLVSMLSFLYVFVYLFRFNFNKSNRLMAHLNRNSYQVYIIHVVVLGVIATLMLNWDIPVFIKFIVLTLLTFIVSNVLVYLYNQLFQKTHSMKKVSAVMAIAALLTITVYAKQANKEQLTAVNTTSTTQIIGLHEAAIQGNLEAVREHIKAGSDLDEKEPTGGSSPLITAIVFGKTEVAKLLIEAGANVNFRNNESSSPLHTAAFFCHIEIIEMLLKYGADKTLVNKYGHTPFQSVSGPYHEVKGVYEFFGKELAPLGLKLDYAQIEMTRPKIAEMLR
ncbi:MAG: acyltransferase family protein [Maribacter sp.]|nr:acyltransferase family protein [Maribacter sp.]